MMSVREAEVVGGIEIPIHSVPLQAFSKREKTHALFLLLWKRVGLEVFPQGHAAGDHGLGLRPILFDEKNKLDIAEKACSECILLNNFVKKIFP